MDVETLTRCGILRVTEFIISLAYDYIKQAFACEEEKSKIPVFVGNVEKKKKKKQKIETTKSILATIQSSYRC